MLSLLLTKNFVVAHLDMLVSLCLLNVGTYLSNWLGTHSTLYSLKVGTVCCLFSTVAGFRCLFARPLNTINQCHRKSEYVVFAVFGFVLILI